MRIASAGSRARRCSPRSARCGPGDTPRYLYTDVTSARVFGGSVRLAERKSAQSTPAFLGLPLARAGGRRHPARAAHGRDPVRVPQRRQGAHPARHSTATRRLERLTSAAWAAFARSGNPSTPELPWPAYDPKRRATMVFDTEPGTVDDPDGAIRERARELMPWSRRDLCAGLVGSRLGHVGGVPASARVEDDLATVMRRRRQDAQPGPALSHRSRSHRARACRPALEPTTSPRSTIDWWLHYPERGGENLFYPGPYTESGIHVTARWQGQRGMFQIGMPLDQGLGPRRRRENVGLLKKDGAPRLSRQGRRVRADLTRRGKLLYRVETEVLDSPAHPLYWHRETGFGAFLYRYRLDPDWRRGPLGPDPVELWLRVLGGKRGVYPQEMVEGAPRQCDPARTRFELVEPSPLDPFAEFPLRSIVGVSYRETGLFRDADKKHHEANTPTRIERLSTSIPKRFEPWAFSSTTGRSPPGKVVGVRGLAGGTDRDQGRRRRDRHYRGRDALVLELRDSGPGRSARPGGRCTRGCCRPGWSPTGARVAHPRPRRRRPATSPPSPFTSSGSCALPARGSRVVVRAVAPGGARRRRGLRPRDLRLAVTHGGDRVVARRRLVRDRRHRGWGGVSSSSASPPAADGGRSTGDPHARRWSVCASTRPTA